MTDELSTLTPGDDRPKTRRPPWLLAIGGAIAGALWLFFHLFSEVREGEVRSFDRTILLAMRVPGDPVRPAGPAWLPDVMRDVTAMGGVTVLTGLVVLVTVFLLLKRLWRPAALIVTATVSGSIAIALLKNAFGRARPDLIDHLMAATDASFPSGHSGNSAIVYFTLASLLFPVVKEARLRAFLIVAAMFITGAIGVSRVYLGVHWPSDVLAGWLFGAAWALGWWAIETRVVPRAG